MHALPPDQVHNVLTTRVYARAVLRRRVVANKFLPATVGPRIAADKPKRQRSDKTRLLIRIGNSGHTFANGPIRTASALKQWRLAPGVANL